MSYPFSSFSFFSPLIPVFVYSAFGESMSPELSRHSLTVTVGLSIFGSPALFFSGKYIVHRVRVPQAHPDVIFIALYLFVERYPSSYTYLYYFCAASTCENCLGSFFICSLALAYEPDSLYKVRCHSSEAWLALGLLTRKHLHCRI
jgi:hypothetical protein